MSVWTRIRDAITALAEGTPLSEILARFSRPPEQSAAFAIAVIALGAKIAKADGQVTRDEIAAFREIFHIPPENEATAARIYNLARRDVAGFESYAAQVAAMFAERPGALADLLEGLVFIAVADGEYHPGEAAFLEEVARIFAVPEAEFRSICARHVPGESDPFAIIGVAPGASPEEVRQAWRTRVRELHPDQMLARGVPEEARRLAEQRLAAINAAYEKIQSERRAGAE
ncbi:MAG: molecular chaperone DjiA [Pseudomonadota bacterium]